MGSCLALVKVLLFHVAKGAGIWVKGAGVWDHAWF